MPPPLPCSSQWLISSREDPLPEGFLINKSDQLSHAQHKRPTVTRSTQALSCHTLNTRDQLWHAQHKHRAVTRSTQVTSCHTLNHTFNTRDQMSHAQHKWPVVTCSTQETSCHMLNKHKWPAATHSCHHASPTMMYPLDITTVPLTCEQKYNHPPCKLLIVMQQEKLLNRGELLLFH